jgi:hypothetical protein
MLNILKGFIRSHRQKDQHLKIMADHLLRCASVIEELRNENLALKQRGDALAFVFEHYDTSEKMYDQIALQVASWREMQGVTYE